MKEINQRTIVIFTIFSVLIFWIGSIYFLTSGMDIPFIKIPEDVEIRSQLGDMFGIVNSLVTTFAFAFIVLNFYQQNNQMKIMKEELDVANKALLTNQNEIKNQQILINEQSSHLKKQSFENSFYNFLSIHNEIVNSMHFNGQNGRNSLHQLEIRLRNNYDNVFQNIKNNDPQERARIAGETAYYNFYGENEQHVGHYFRRLYNLVKVVEETSIPFEEQYKYTRIIRSQLSNSEIILLFYNAQSSFGRAFKDSIWKIKLLKGISRKSLLTGIHWDLGVKENLIHPDWERLNK